MYVEMVYSGFVFENRCLSGRQARWRISRLEMWKITEVKMEVNCIMNFEARWLLGYHFRRILLPVWWPAVRSSAPLESIPVFLDVPASLEHFVFSQSSFCVEIHRKHSFSPRGGPTSHLPMDRLALPSLMWC